MLQLHSQTKVAQLDESALRDEQIVRLDVLSIYPLQNQYPVDDVGIMEVAQPKQATTRDLP